MDEKKKKLDIPPNYVTLAQLEERWLKEQERKKEKEKLELRKEKKEEVHEEGEEEKGVVATVAVVEGEGEEKASRNEPKKKKKTTREQGKKGKEVGRELLTQGGEDGIQAERGGGVVESEKGGRRERKGYGAKRGVKIEYRPRMSDSVEIAGRVENSARKVKGEVGRWFNGRGKGSRRDVGENEDKSEGLVRIVDGMSGNRVEMESEVVGESDRMVGIKDVAGGSEVTVGVERKKGKLGEILDRNERSRRWHQGNREMRKEFRVGRSEIGEKVDKREGLVGIAMDGIAVEMDSGEAVKSNQRDEDVDGENESAVEIERKIGDMMVESGNRGREVHGGFVSQGSGVYGVGENGQERVGGGRVDYRRYGSGERQYKIESDMVVNEDKNESLLRFVDGMDGNGVEMESGKAGKVDQKVGIEEVVVGDDGSDEIELKLGEMSVESENGEMKVQSKVIKKGNGGYYGFRSNRQYGGGGGGGGVGWRYGGDYGGYRQYGGGSGNFKNWNRPGNEQRGVDGNVKVWVKKEEAAHGGGSISGHCGQSAK